MRVKNSLMEETVQTSTGVKKRFRRFWCCKSKKVNLEIHEKNYKDTEEFGWLFLGMKCGF